MPLPPALPRACLLLIIQVSAGIRVLAQIFMATLTKYILLSFFIPLPICSLHNIENNNDSNHN